MRSSWITVGPKSSVWYPYKKRRHRHTYGGEGPVKTEVEIEPLKPTIAGSPQEMEEGRKNSSLEPSEGARPC